MDGNSKEEIVKKTNFEKNLKALKGGWEYDKLCKKLENFTELKDFDFTQGKDNLDINIIRKKDCKKIYSDPVGQLQKDLEYFKDFIRYPALFFYGFGNGILYKILLKNKHLKRIIIF